MNDLSAVTDEALLQRFDAGERHAFEALVRRHQGRLYSFVLRHLQHAETAQEVVQETFVRVVTSRGGFRQDARFSTWLFSIARNLCLDELRKQRVRRHTSLDQSGPSRDGDSGPSLLERTIDPHSNTEREAARGELRDRMSWAIERLPTEQREVFLLREVAGLSFREIAEATDTAENTVKSRMRYALERLQEGLREFERLLSPTAGS